MVQGLRYCLWALGWILGTSAWACVNDSTAADAPLYELVGQFYDPVSGEPVDSVEVVVVDIKTNVAQRTITDTGGHFSIPLNRESVFQVSGAKPNFFEEGGQTFSTIGKAKYTKIRLRFIISAILPGNAYLIEGLDFGVNDCGLSSKATAALDRLYKILYKNPLMQIEIACHTDARGDDEYNLYISELRAKAIVQYLTERGIAPARMQAAGYGETKLTNHCADGVRCSTAEHLANRRVTFTIVGNQPY